MKLSLFSLTVPHNLGAVAEDLHVDVAGPVGLSHDVDLTEFSLRSEQTIREAQGNRGL